MARRQKGTERNQKKRLRAFRMSIMISLSDGKGERERGALGDFCLISVSPLFFPSSSFGGPSSSSCLHNPRIAELLIQRPIPSWPFIFESIPHMLPIS